MSRKFLKMFRKKSGVGNHHEKHCLVNNSAKREKYAGKTSHCFVLNTPVDISSIGECLRAGDCGRLQ